jgi:drug/metabolite transporter (DMT)-like permease
MNKHFILPLTTSILFSGSYIAAKYTTFDLAPLTTTLFRYSIALLFLSCLLFHYKVSSLKIKKRDIVKLASLGLFGIVGYHYFFFVSLKFTAVANTAIINSLCPLLTAVFATIFLHERLRPINYFGVFIAFIGVIILLTNGSISVLFERQPIKGDLLMMLASLNWVIYTLLVKTLTDSYSGFTLTFYSMLFGVLFLSVLAIHENYILQLRNVSFESVLSLFYMGICASGLGYLLFNMSINKIGPTKTTSFVYSFVPIFVSILALVFFAQSITFIMAVSTFLIVFAIRYVLTNSKPKLCLQK